MQKKRKKISENKQYITVDNSDTLLYTVCRRRDEVEPYYKSYFHGTNL